MSSAAKRSVLLICPTFPRGADSGLAIRAASWLLALRQLEVDVELLVIPVSDGFRLRIPSETKALCSRVTVIRPSIAESLRRRFRKWLNREPAESEPIWVSEHVEEKVTAFLDRSTFDLVVLHRFYMVSAVAALLAKNERATQFILDIDDIESITRRRFAALYRNRGDAHLARKAEMMAEMYARREQKWLPLLEAVTVCSEGDRSFLQERFGLEHVLVVPNAISLPGRAVERPGRKWLDVFRFIFVGNFSYFPNQDAVEFLLDEVIEPLRACTARPFELLILGSGKTSRLATASQKEGIRIIGRVADLNPWYAMAQAAVIPIRAGGGTRLKAIEAMAHHCPIIGTSIGLDGLGVQHERTALIADCAQSFIAQCARMIADESLRERIASEAFTLFESRYSQTRFNDSVSKLLQLPEQCRESAIARVS